ncbi:MAG: hypothetical protein ACPIA7_09060 [Akkermansiaceae bacterium]
MKSLILSIVLSTSVCAAEKQASQKNDTSVTANEHTSKDGIIENLFTFSGQTGFDTAYANAQQAGIHPQVLLEARFLHLVDLGNYSKIAGLVPELIAHQKTFDPDQSEIFALVDDWSAITHYAQALEALESNNKQSFKKHITEAFWLSPRQAQAFGPHIEKLRLKEAMNSTQLPLNTILKSQHNNENNTIAEHTKKSRGIVLYFWNPMSQEIQMQLPDFITTTQVCNENNISVLAILTAKYPDIIQDAETIRIENAADAKCTWLIDSNKKSLGSLLWVRNLPTAVITSPEGQVLFNGHPTDEEFWTVLKKISPTLKRPNRNKN